MPYALDETISYQFPPHMAEVSFSSVGSSKERRKKAEVQEWKIEIRKTASRYHLIGAWVGLVFNFVFSIADYISFPNLWEQFFVVRLIVSMIILTGIVLHKPLKWSVEWVIYIPFVLICIENAYMWSFMDIEMVQKHTLSYIAVFIGAGMLVVWEMKYSVSIIIISLFANFYFFNANSPIDITTMLSAGGILTLSVAVFSILLIQTRYNLNRKATIARLALEESNDQLIIQKQIVEEKSQDIIESIRYAQNIQEAILPDGNVIGRHFPDHCILFLPKDIVSGDFYWFKNFGNISVLAAVDCTGHGVPGAFMSMIGNTLMNKIISDQHCFNPADILHELRLGIIEALDQGGGKSNDSMDMSLVVVNHDEEEISFAGANNPLLYISENKMNLIKGDKMPIGSHYKKVDEPFISHVINYKKGDCIYLMSDGYADQFGGLRDKKFSMKRIQNLLLEMHNQSMTSQKIMLERTFQNWKGSQSQIDDVLVMGVRL